MKPHLDPGERAVKWISNLTLCDDYIGQPFKLEPWQADILRKLFGTLTPEGIRQYRQMLLLLGRKQGKSQLCAAMATYFLLGEGKQGHYIAVAAADREQASHLFNKIVTMIQADPYLDRQVTIYHSKKRIETKRGGNIVQVLSSEGRRQLGSNISVLLFDELLAQKDRRLYDALTSGSSTRQEPVTIYISTQGNRRDSLIWQTYDYARKVRDGVVDDPTFLPVIYEVPEEDDWTDEANWHKAMPAFGSFGNKQFFRDELVRAKAIPSEESKFRQYYLNQFVAAEGKWLNLSAWENCGHVEVEPEALKGRRSFWGLDLSSSSDITALVGVFPMDDGTYQVLCHFWIAGDYATERDRKGHTHYHQWARDPKTGLEITPGYYIDHPYLEQRIPEILDEYDVGIVNVDPFGPALSTIQRIQAAGYPVQTFRQGWVTMSPAIKKAEMLVGNGLVHHGNNPILNWMADNVVVHKDRQDNHTFDKGNSADKIDGMVALVMGLAGATQDIPEPEPSIFILGG